MEFFKYQGTGNDFIMIDKRSDIRTFSTEEIKRLCDRRFGIGADGLIFLKSHPQYDFEMEYYNADGNESSMCGNGGRCIVQFANDLGIIGKKCSFIAVDGEHDGVIEDHGTISLKMADVEEVEVSSDYYFMDTGSPHYIRFVENVEAVDLITDAQAIRYNERFKEEGTNVNFLHSDKEVYYIRTYERGVEGETLSCGTGATAGAIAISIKDKIENKVALQTRGGKLVVHFKREQTAFTNIWLSGAASRVFKGTLSLL